MDAAALLLALLLPLGYYTPATKEGAFYQISLKAWKPGGPWASDKMASAGKTRSTGFDRQEGGKGTYYHRFYPYFVEHLRTIPFNMLEIGLAEGGSLALWKKYFPLANIYGADIVQKEAFGGPRVKIFQAAQQDVSALERMIRSIPPRANSGYRQPLSLIIDDASHESLDIITSFEYLFLHGLEPGGVYTAEDLSVCYDQFEGGRLYKATPVTGCGRESDLNVVNYFRELAHLVNRRVDASRMALSYNHTFRPGVASPSGCKNEPSTQVADWVSMVTFAQSSVYIVKKTEEDFQSFPYACGYSDDKTWANLNAEWRKKNPDKAKGRPRSGPYNKFKYQDVCID